VGVAQALINDPALVFLDDPMLGLDPVGRREVRDLILELRRQGKTIVFSTHILPDVETLCDRVAILNGGRLHGLGHLDTLLNMRAKAHEVLVSEPTEALAAALGKIANGVHRAGDKLNATVTPEQLFAAVDCVRQHGGQLLAVTPVHTSLEDYFFETFGTEKMPELAEKG
jgi:ABC-2 type transport system ATP-binding protein